MSSSSNVTGITDSATTENGGRVQFTIDSHRQGQGQSIMIMTGDTSSGLDFNAEI